MKYLPLLLLALGLSSPALAKHEKIWIQSDANGCPVLAEPENPCGGSEDVCFTSGSTHKISWQYRGRGQAFEIQMKNAQDDAIFVAGCRGKKQKVTCDLRQNAPQGSYSYSIVVDNQCMHDPRIIIN